MVYPTISLIILNYNGKDIIPTALDSVKKLKYPKGKLETIVIDNASQDGSVEFIRKKYPFVKILETNENRGYVALNDGVEICDGEFCFLLNNDIEIHPDCLHEMVKIFEKFPQAVIASPTMYFLTPKKIAYTKKYISRCFYNGSDVGDVNEYEDAYTGVPFLRTSFAKKLPYVFDPDYFIYVEDVDLGYRVRLLGYKIHRNPKAILYHDGGATTKAIPNPFLTFHREKNVIQTYLKNLQARNIIIWFPYFLLFRFFSLGNSIKSLQFGNMVAIFKAWYWNVTNFKRILRKRKVIQKSRKMSDKQIFKHIGNELSVWKYLLSNTKNPTG